MSTGSLGEKVCEKPVSCDGAPLAEHGEKVGRHGHGRSLLALAEVVSRCASEVQLAPAQRCDFGDP
jgi:hypothetical protein